MERLLVEFHQMYQRYIWSAVSLPLSLHNPLVSNYTVFSASVSEMENAHFSFLLLAHWKWEVKTKARLTPLLPGPLAARTLLLQAAAGGEQSPACCWEPCPRGTWGLGGRQEEHSHTQGRPEAQCAASSSAAVLQRGCPGWSRTLSTILDPVLKYSFL